MFAANLAFRTGSSRDQGCSLKIPIEIYDYAGPGYQPLLLRPTWQVALLNWDEKFERSNLREIEQHRNTDEVFVLLKGRAALFVEPEGEQVLAFDCQPGVIYNVPAGIWHTLLADRDATFLIVEERDTHLTDTHLRLITHDELQAIDAQLPAWVSSDDES
jgi:mannose-6-phosphate isomerase-like protein (cupin superfamily)